MSLFSRDKEQDDRLDSIESHVRMLTEMMNQNELDISSVRLELVRLGSVIDTKLPSEAATPELLEMGQKISDARKLLQEATAAAEDNWTDVQSKVQSAVGDLRSELRALAEEQQRRLQQAVDAASDD